MHAYVFAHCDVYISESSQKANQTMTSKQGSPSDFSAKRANVDAEMAPIIAALVSGLGKYFALIY